MSDQDEVLSEDGEIEFVQRNKTIRITSEQKELLYKLFKKATSTCKDFSVKHEKELVMQLVEHNLFKNQLNKDQIKRAFAKYKGDIAITQLMGCRFRDTIHKLIKNKFLSQSVMKIILCN